MPDTQTQHSDQADAELLQATEDRLERLSRSIKSNATEERELFLRRIVFALCMISPQAKVDSMFDQELKDFHAEFGGAVEVQL